MARPRSDINDRVLSAAAARFLHDGVDGASLREIAKDAGTSVGMVSYYFPTKDDLFIAVVEDKYRKFLDDVTAALAPDAPFETQVLRLYSRLGAMTDDEFRVIRVVIREALVASPRMPRLLQRFSEGHIPVVFAAIARAVARGELRDDVHPVLVVASLFGQGFIPQVFRRLMLPAMPAHIDLPSPEEVARTMRDLLLYGIAKRPTGAAAREDS